MKKHRFRIKWGWVIALSCTAALAAVVWYFAPNWLDGWKAQRVVEQMDGLYVPSARKAELSTATPMPTVIQTPPPTEEPSPTPTKDKRTEATPEPTETPIPAPTPMPTVPPVQEDFLDMYEKNAHIIGWLNCGEKISYPVVQSDNDYYLHHDFFGRRDNNGTIFLNANNTLWPADDVLLIHGHNMTSGAMFGRLYHYRDEAYMREYPIVTFRTIYDAQDVYYVPIAAFDASMVRGAKGYFDITQIRFPDDDELEALAASAPEPEATLEVAMTVRQSTAFQTYLDDILALSRWESPADVNVDDQLLMLVTCSYYHENGRLMLVCRKLRQDETPEQMTELFMPAAE
ncbi:MAG: class B sortase [Syntrophomonadaceae bacterium]|nr:class B sortase [Syntrophomonadaceae bacterium]